MNKLPSEILKVIFSHLHYSQKLQCKLVCRKLANVLQSGLDIESVAIPIRIDEKTGSRFSLPLIEKVQSGILNGENCRRLILYDYPDRALLAKLFPNLKLIYFLSQKSSSVELTPERIGYLQSWHKNLETYMDFSCDKIALGILDSGVFQKLTKMALYSHSMDDIKMTTFADKLKNAPNLKNLDLISFQVHVTDLEKLHSNVPCLESLVLQHCTVESPEKIPRVIQPAETMKAFALIECDHIDGFTMTLSQYVVCAYPSLERFSLIVRERDYFKLIDLKENPIHYIIQKFGHTLRALNANTFHRSPNILIELTNNAPLLEELTTDVRGEMNLLTPILESNTLTNTLHSLTFYHMPSINFKVFNRFCHLKQLCLSFEFSKSKSQFFDLDIIINSLPESLDVLKLEYVGLDLSSTFVNNTSAHPIKSLAMKSCIIRSDLSGYLSHCFPKLKSLIVVHCETEFHFELPNHHLSFVEFYLHRYGQKKGRMSYHPKLFKLTTNGNATTFYEYTMQKYFQIIERWNCELFDKHDRLKYDINKPSTVHHEENGLDYFHFRCASVQTLLLNKELIL